MDGTNRWNVRIPLPKRWEYEVALREEVVGRKLKRFPLRVWKDPNVLTIGDARFVDVPRDAIDHERHLRKPTPYVAAPPKYAQAVRLFSYRPDAIVRGVSIDQCVDSPWPVGQLCKDGPCPPEVTKNWCVITVRVEQVFDGPAALRGKLLRGRGFRAYFKWVRAGERRLAQLRRSRKGTWFIHEGGEHPGGPMPGLPDWAGPDLRRNPEFLRLAEQIGRGFSRSRANPDLEAILGPHPLLEEFRSVPGIAIVTTRDLEPARSADGCLTAVRVKPLTVLSGRLPRQGVVALRVSEEVSLPENKFLAGYEMTRKGPLLLQVWPLRSHLIVAAAAVKRVPVP